MTTTEPVPPGDLTVNLPRDLETITLKCLQKEPAKRYPTAADLADDLQRFLDGKPIQARPVPAWEKAWKWAKRRPAWAALIATVFLGVTAVAAGGVWFNASLRHERDIARTERDRANENARIAEERFQLNREAIDRYFTGVSESDLLDEPGLQPLREKLLGLAKDYYALFVEERRDDPSVRGDLARSLGRLARITAELKDPRQAIALYLQAMPIYEELAAANPNDSSRRVDIAGTWYELSKLYRLTNQTKPAEEACSTAVAQWEKLAQEYPAEPKYRSELARSLTSRSNLEFSLGRLSPARTTCEQALAVRQKLAAELPNDPAVLRDLATTWDNLANLRAVAREAEPSADARRKAADIFRRLVTDYPYRSLYRNDLARVQFNLGTQLLRADQPEPGAASLREAVEQWDRLHNLHPAVREYHVSLGNAVFALAQATWVLGQGKEADATLSWASSVRTELAKQYPAIPEYVAELARCDAADGDHTLQRGLAAAAAEAFARAADRVAPLADKHRDVPQYRVDLARYRLNQGKALGLAGDAAAGRTAIDRAIELWTALRENSSVGGAAQVELLDCWHAFGDLERRAGHPDKALVWFDRSIEAAEPLLQRNTSGARRQLRDAWWGKAEALTALRKYVEALAAWDQAIALDDESQEIYLKVFRLATAARTNEYEQALLDLDLLAAQARVNGQALVHVARVYALAAGTAAADTKQPQTERDRRSNDAAERAVEHLRLAQTKGYFANIAARTNLARDADFAALRGRPDFQKFLADLEVAPE